MNKQLFKLYHVTYDEYAEWCKANRYPAYRTSTKSTFFNLLMKGELVKNEAGKYVKK